jgi:hypothetical protein
MLRGHWNVHAPTEDKTDCVKNSFCEEFLIPTVGNKSLHEISNYIGIREVNFATSKNLTVEMTMFPH